MFERFLLFTIQDANPFFSRIQVRTLSMFSSLDGAFSTTGILWKTLAFQCISPLKMPAPQAQGAENPPPCTSTSAHAWTGSATLDSHFDTSADALLLWCGRKTYQLWSSLNTGYDLIVTCARKLKMEPEVNQTKRYGPMIFAYLNVGRSGVDLATT